MHTRAVNLWSASLSARAASLLWCAAVVAGLPSDVPPTRDVVIPADQLFAWDPDTAVLTEPGTGSPMRWGCDPVRYRVNTHLMPPGLLAEVLGTFSRVAETTGVRFVFDGTTSDFPVRSPSEGYEVIVGWVEHLDHYVPGVDSPIGVTQHSVSLDTSGTPRYVSAYVALAADLEVMGDPTGGPGPWTSVLLHEALHAAGITQHIPDDTVMDPMLDPERLPAITDAVRDAAARIAPRC